MVDRVGQQLGNYRLSRLLGKGGFAEVYLGEHVYIGTQAAIKVLSTQLAGEDSEQFRVEATTLAHLEHPHIVRVLDFGVEGTMPFLVMSYAPGGTLRTLHPKGSRLPLSTVVSYVKQIASALQYAHDQKLIHRDVKPENMLLGQHQEVLLSDFGIALVAQTSRHQLTLPATGTVAYMAPEQIQGKPRPASDQYSLGIIVYEWLSGTLPFTGSLLELYGQHLHVSPAPLCEKVPSISREVEQVVMLTLAKDPKQRFANVQAFAIALEQASLVEDSETLPMIRSAQQADEITVLSQSQQPTEVVTRPSESQQPAERVSPPSQSSLPTKLSPPSSHTVLPADAMTVPSESQQATELVAPPGQVFMPKDVISKAAPTEAATRSSDIAGVGERVPEVVEERPRQAEEEGLREARKEQVRKTEEERPRKAEEERAPKVAEANIASAPTLEAYCVKCKKKVAMQNAHEVTTKNGRLAIQGTCSVCGTVLFRFRKAEEEEGAKKIKEEERQRVEEERARKSEEQRARQVAEERAEEERLRKAKEERAQKAREEQAREAEEKQNKRYPQIDVGELQARQAEEKRLRKDRREEQAPKVEEERLRDTSSHPPVKQASVRVAQPGPEPTRKISRRTMIIGLVGAGVTAAVAGGGLTWWILTPHPLVYRGHSGGVSAVAWSPDGKRIASGGGDHTVQVWDATNGGNVFTYRGHSHSILSVAWSPDGRRIASASEYPDSLMQVWDAADGGHVFTYRSDQAEAYAVAWSPDGKYIASGGSLGDHIVQVWNAADGGHVFTYREQVVSVLSVYTVAWSPDGKRIASGSGDVQVWDATNGGNVFTYHGHDNSVVNAVAWSPDGKRIASASEDGTVQVWDAVDGGHVFTYRGHSTDNTVDYGTVDVLSVAWSPDGKRIASASDYGTVQVWDAVDGGHVFTYHGHHGFVRAAWSPDGKYIASAGSSDKTVQVWQVQ